MPDLYDWHKTWLVKLRFLRPCHERAAGDTELQATGRDVQTTIIRVSQTGGYTSSEHHNHVVNGSRHHSEVDPSHQRPVVSLRIFQLDFRPSLFSKFSDWVKKEKQIQMFEWANPCARYQGRAEYEQGSGRSTEPTNNYGEMSVALPLCNTLDFSDY